MDNLSDTITLEVPLLLTEAQVAEALGIKPQTLKHRRHARRDVPRHVKVGGAVRYKPSDVREYLAGLNEADGADQSGD